MLELWVQSSDLHFRMVCKLPFVCYPVSVLVFWFLHLSAASLLGQLCLCPGTGTCQLVQIQAGPCQLAQIQAGACQLVQIQAGTGAAAEAVRPALHVTAQGSQARSPGPPEAFSYASEIFFSNSVIFCRDIAENQ